MVNYNTRIKKCLEMVLLVRIAKAQGISEIQVDPVALQFELLSWT